MKTRHHPYQQFCVNLRQHDLLRSLPHSQVAQYDFSHNDYLNLSQHPAMIRAAIEAATTLGVGARASRLLANQQQPLRALEQQIAKDKHSGSAMIFATGYQANVSVLSALLDSKTLGQTPLVFSDKLNHASMHAGCALARVKQQRYRHTDYDHLAWLLAKTRSAKLPRFILTESVFGMDGDIACLSTLCKLARDYQAILYVDEAHATGLFGSKGYGFTSDYGQEIDISMGTFSKALGGSGAYVACSKPLKRYLINRANGFIYSTAPSPMQVAVMHKSWEIIPSMQPAAQVLMQQAAKLRLKLQALGYNTGNSSTHIIPIILQQANQTLAAQRLLAKRNIQVSAIRPPSVPINQSRLRIALNTGHNQLAIAALLNAFNTIKI